MPNSLHSKASGDELWATPGRTHYYGQRCSVGLGVPLMAMCKAPPKHMPPNQHRNVAHKNRTFCMMIASRFRHARLYSGHSLDTQWTLIGHYNGHSLDTGRTRVVWWLLKKTLTYRNSSFSTKCKTPTFCQCPMSVRCSVQ